MSLIKIDNYCLQTPNQRILKDKVSLELYEGEVLVISGANGSGKTTLLKKIEDELKVSFFTLPQISEGEINFPFTIADLVAEINHSFTISQLKTPFNQASGGERRKALFYYLLEQEKEVLLLDEPFNHLDQKTVEELLVLLKNALQEKKIKGLILISHSHNQLISDHLSFKEYLL